MIAIAERARGVVDSVKRQYRAWQAFEETLVTDGVINGIEYLFGEENIEGRFKHIAEEYVPVPFVFQRQ